MTYDSRLDTLDHIASVQTKIEKAVINLRERATVHDQSKLEDPEKEAFDRLTPALKSLTYGSPEYKESLAQLGEALDHHYENNTHHPEHWELWECPTCGKCFKRYKREEVIFTEDDQKHYLCPHCLFDEHDDAGIELVLVPGSGTRRMSLLDLLEMLIDWKSATERHEDGSMEKSLTLNQQRFGYGNELAQILRNTAQELGFLKVEDGKLQED